MNMQQTSHEISHPLERVVSARTDNYGKSKADPESIAVARELLIEAVAAQLYMVEMFEGKNATRRTGHGAFKFWRDINVVTRQQYRDMARRKLKTGEIFGWPK